ncbi:MAG: thioesterase II family protein [Acidimicrobiales bacterium]
MNATRHPDRWLRRYRVRAGASLRLLCLPHAGGAPAAYRSWDALLPEAVELLVACYPGREDRRSDAVPGSIHALADGIALAVAPLLDRPWLAFGHSMGAVVAYETVQQLRRLGHPEPLALYVSGRQAPDLGLGGDVHTRDDDGLVDELVRLGGTHAEILADPDMRAAVLDMVRGDYRMAETYRPRPGRPLSCPIGVLRGTDDPELDETGAAAWSQFTTGPLTTRVFPGDHFYLGPRRAAVVSAVLEGADPALVRQHPPWMDMP